MRFKVLLHTAVFLSAIAALKIFVHRAVAENTKDGILSPHNLPLAALVLAAILLAELSSRKFTNAWMFLFAFFAAVFFVSSFYLSPESQFKDEASVVAYAALLLMLSTAFVTAASKRAGFSKILSTAFLIFIVCTFIGFIYTFSDGEAFNRNSKTDAAVVLGASVWGKQRPSPLLRGRLDGAIKIFKSGRAKKIVVTGGTKRFGTVESEVEAAYLQENGIPDSDIIKEHSTLSTADQARFVKDVLIDSLGMKRIVIVSDKWHLPRVLLMCGWDNASVKGMASDYRMSIPGELYYRLRESAAMQVYLLFGV